MVADIEMADRPHDDPDYMEAAILYSYKAKPH